MKLDISRLNYSQFIMIDYIISKSTLFPPYRWEFWGLKGNADRGYSPNVKIFFILPLMIPKIAKKACYTDI